MSSAFFQPRMEFHESLDYSSRHQMTDCALGDELRIIMAVTEVICDK